MKKHFFKGFCIRDGQIKLTKKKIIIMTTKVTKKNKKVY